MDRRLESSNRDKVLRRVARQLRQAEFVRTKPTFFTWVGDHVIEFVHLHKFTKGPSFRVHLGIRVINDSFDACALNGPTGPEPTHVPAARDLMHAGDEPNL
jgi:hypothetical protein